MRITLFIMTLALAACQRDTPEEITPEEITPVMEAMSASPPKIVAPVPRELEDADSEKVQPITLDLTIPTDLVEDLDVEALRADDQSVPNFFETATKQKKTSISGKVVVDEDTPFDIDGVTGAEILIKTKIN